LIRGKKDCAAIARRHAEGVVSGAIPAYGWVRKACRRQLEDLVRTGFDHRFDEKKASRVCRFIEELSHIEGEWAKTGTPALAGLHPDDGLRVGVEEHRPAPLQDGLPRYAEKERQIF
jgi:hypothetical protein